MDDVVSLITSITESLIDDKVNQIKLFEPVTNNTVYKVTSMRNQAYIFKLYKERYWPEDGKLMFVHNKLHENNINCAKIIDFNRANIHFPNGYLLETYITGINAATNHIDNQSLHEIYKKLARQMSIIHQIQINNFGYIGNGVADYTTFLDFMNDKFDEISHELITKGLFDTNFLQQIKQIVLERLGLCNHYPSVLNHGDLSTKNVMVDEDGELTLIDWDDAMSLNWIADIARLTYWMRNFYDTEHYIMYRNCFLDHYHYDNMNVSEEFARFENVFHIWIGLDHLNYSAFTPQYDKYLNYFNETLHNLFK